MKFQFRYSVKDGIIQCTFIVKMNLRRSQKLLPHVWWLQSGLPSGEVTPGANTLTLILLYLNLYLLFSFDDY